MDFSKLKRRPAPPETTVVLFGNPKTEEEMKHSINRVAITGRKVSVTPRIKDYEVAFPGDKGASMGQSF